MKPTILVLEDEVDQLTQLSRLLEPLGYDVRDVQNGAQAKAIIVDKKVTIVAAVLDMHIGNSDTDTQDTHLGDDNEYSRGVTVGKLLIQHQGAIPIVFASAHDRDKQARIVEEAGFSGPHAFFPKEQLFNRDPSLLEHTLRMAIQASFVLTGDEAPSPVSNLNKPEAMAFRVPSQRTDDAYIRKIVRRDEIVYLKMTKLYNLVVQLKDGRTLLTGIRLGHFKKAYEEMIARGAEDFLVVGHSEGSTIFLNIDAVESYDSNYVYLKGGDSLIAGTSLITNLGVVFPVMG